MNTPRGNHAIVRDVPDTYNNCIKPYNVEIDVWLAREQHKLYCQALAQLGLRLIRIDADDKYPDCCFVEDTAIIIDDKAIMLHIGAPSRVGEEMEVRKQLADYLNICEIYPPATIDGGDVLRIGKQLFVGISQRTNFSAIEQLQTLVSGDAHQVIPVPVQNTIHLKSSCSYIGNNHVVVYASHFDDGLFSGYKKIIVHENEAYSANCLAINGKVLVSKGYPYTKERIESAGFETVELEMSEFRKGGGSLTCLSIVF